MKWLRISSKGSLDIASAVNMLGASVKTGKEPIGIFGSGLKYAMAQAGREDIPIKISSNGQIYSTMTKKETFRDEEFPVVYLKTETGKKIRTPMTTRFGIEDWKDTWFIFREFFSNAIDEGSHQIDIVNSVEPIEGSTCVFLPYNNFATVYEKLDEYFTKKEQGCWVGNGNVYRNGVFIGKFNNCNINVHSSAIRINECRTMDTYSAQAELVSWLGACHDKNVWVEFFKTPTSFLDGLYLNISEYDSSLLKTAVHAALIEVYGENYCICPNVNDIIHDVESMGYNPVILHGIKINSNIFKTFESLDSSSNNRPMNEDETIIFNRIRKSISGFIPDDCQPEIRVISEGAAQIFGQADMVNKIIYIRGTLFEINNYKKLVNTIIHEFGHIVTGRGDYDRMFTDFFIDKLTELSM